MTGTSQEPSAKPEQRGITSHPVWAAVGIAANVIGIAGFLNNPTSTATALLAVVAFLLGIMLLWSCRGQIVGGKVVLAVVVIVVGAVLGAVIVTRSVVVAPQQQAQQPAPDAAPPAQQEQSTSAPTSDIAPTAPPTSSAPESGAVSRASGDEPIVLTAGYGLDLDSQEPYWVAEPSGGDGEDLSFSSSQFYAWEDLATAAPEATLEDCIRAGYRSAVKTDEVTAGSAYCVKTDGGTYARVVVRERREDEMALDVVVWKKPS